MSGREGHWFDRLAAHTTRREMLRTALAGGTALGVATLAPRTARADDADACLTGCDWTLHQRTVGRLQDCQTITAGAAGVLTAGAIVAGYGFINPVGSVVHAAQAAVVAGQKCQEIALGLAKGDAFDCLLPNCGGFDPNAKGGPCETCMASCCPDPNVISGYSCCTLGCACGSDTGACHAGVTPC